MIDLLCIRAHWILQGRTNIWERSGLCKSSGSFLCGPANGLTKCDWLVSSDIIQLTSAMGAVSYTASHMAGSSWKCRWPSFEL